MNLLSNAINYTQEGGRVKLTAREKHSNRNAEDIVEFVVKDSGIGIPKKDLPVYLNVSTGWIKRVHADQAERA